MGGGEGVGPGQYYPNIKAVKKSTPSYNWGISKSIRIEKDAKLNDSNS